jgi:Ran GTPase-activating protein (RanGAP) involved in mRNA processing and transport
MNQLNQNETTLKTIEDWKQLALQSMNSDTETIDKIATQFATELMIEYKKYSADQSYISNCAIGAPTLRSSIDNKTNIARLIATKIFLPENQNHKPLVKLCHHASYIPILNILIKKCLQPKYHNPNFSSFVQYTKLLSTLRKPYHAKIDDAKKKKHEKTWEQNEYKRARANGECSLLLYKKLKAEKMSDQIINPTPMPVSISSLDELEPFFKFLESGEELKTTDATEFMKFTRGVIYNDGRIDLCKQVVGPTYIHLLMNSIIYNPHVKHFLLGNNIIDTIGAEEIAKFINHDKKNDVGTNPRLARIITWYLAGNCINYEGIQKIAFALETDTDADSLYLKRNPISPLGANYLSLMLEMNSTLRVLDLQNCGLLDEGVKNLLFGLKNNTGLRHLYLDSNGITEVGAQYIANYFDHINSNNLHGLSSLWLEVNRIGNDGIKTIAASLKNNKNLKRLAVGSNRIEESGFEFLCHALLTHPKIQMLNIGMYKSTADLGELPNRIENGGMVHLAKLITSNPNIKILSVFNNNIDNVGIKILADAIKENNSVLYIEYGQYGLVVDKDSAYAISTKINENCLRELGMDYNTFVKNKLRFMKHTSRVKYIDSVYRNKM